ncbi:MAG: DUF4136 domain-containing protein [Terriglobales bacterium]
MKVQRAVFVFMLVVFGLATTSFTQTVKTDYDRNANFSRYKTYSWTKVETASPLWVDRIKNAVNIELAGKGWTQVAKGGDVSIAAVEITREHSAVLTYYGGLENWQNSAGSGNDYVVKREQVGTLVVQLFDNGTKKLAWRGSSANTLSSKSKKNIKNFDKGVQELFEHFPPKPQD